MNIKKQKNEKDCGLYVLEYFIRKETGQKIAINILKSHVEYSEQGISLNQLTDLASKYNLELKSFEVEVKDLLTANINKEFIALINSDGYNHYVVAEIIRDQINIKDPSKGEYKMSIDEFKTRFLKIITLVEKTQNQQIKLKKQKALKALLPHKPALFTIGFLSILISVCLMFVSTIFMKIVLDKVLPQHLDKTLIFLVLAFSIVACLRVSNMLIKSIVIKRVQNIYELELLNMFKSKIFLAQKNELNKFTENDILRRWGYIGSVSAMFANGFFVILNGTFVFLISMVMLIYIHSSAFAIVFAFGALMIINVLVFTYFSKAKTEIILEKQMHLLNASHDFVRNINLIKNPLFFQKFSKQINIAQENLKENEMKMFNMSLLSRVISELINLLMPIIITFVNSLLIFDNKMSIGQMMMLISASTFFLGSLNDISGFSISYISFRRENKLFEDVLKIKNEEKNTDGLGIGDIKKFYLENFSFAYDRKVYDIPLLEINSNLRIIGKNGSGKSTFLKSLAGLEMGRGVIKINDVNQDFYSLDSLREKVIYISSDTYLPKMKIIDYVCDSKESKLIFEKNLIDLSINKIIENAKLNLNTEMVNGGTNFSAGQKQIISLLRIFSQDHKLLLLDEAFENVDTTNFNFFKNALKNYAGLIFEISHSKRFVKNGKEVNFESYSTI